MFILTLPMWFIMVYFFMNNQPYTPFSLMGITMIAERHYSYSTFSRSCVYYKKKMAKDITSVPVRWSNGINKLYLAYNCYVACIRNIVQNDYLAPLWVGPLFCIGFYTLQIFISRWWLSRYQYGPLEYIWRLGTYGKMMPLKRKARSRSKNKGSNRTRFEPFINFTLLLPHFVSELVHPLLSLYAAAPY